MGQRAASGNTSTMITAERRRRILDLALQQGAVSVSDLAAGLSVAENTIRNDLDNLCREGKLVRSYGGAIVKETGLPVLPYSQIRDANMRQKSWIAAEAIKSMPETGRVFINAGSTTYQLALRLQERHRVDVTTNSPEIAVHLASNTAAQVELIGGKMVKDSLETDGTLSAEALDRLYWDAAFMGISAIDTDHGITSINLACAGLERQILEASRRVIGLCDSSKLGRFSNARAGDTGLIDVLITDNGAKPALIEALSNTGIQVVVVGPSE